MYEQFFGLNDEPFRLTPDPRYLFLSTKHAEALAHLRLGLSESSGFVCITGDVGTGKTTLVRTFLSQLGPNVTAVYSLVPPLSAAELLRKVCRELGLPVEEQSQTGLVEQLHAYLVAQHEAGRICVLVLDEAQALSIELLEQIRLLLNLETETQKLLRIVLVGQPQLRKLLLDPELAQLNQRITLRWHLGPLSYRETVAYINHRFSVASGGRAVQIFTQPALRLLYSVSAGIPRLINMIAHRALLAAFVARQVRIRRREVARAYREIQVVPLPGTLTPARKAAWAAAGLVIGITLVAFGAPAVDRLLNHPTPALTESPGADPAPAVGDGSVGPQVVREPEARAPAAKPAPAQAAAPPAAPAPAEVASSGGSPAAVVPPPVVMPPLAKPQVAMPAAVAPKELLQTLARLELADSAVAATDVVLAAWDESSLTADETRLPADLASVAWRRGLQDLVLKTDLGMLRTLNLPAVIGLRVPAVKGLRYVGLVRIDGAHVVLSVDGVQRSVDANELEQIWSGDAYVFWRDFKAVGAGLRWGARGPAVVRLQQLLVRAGVLLGTPTGTFDSGTETGVTNFQRAHKLDADGIVGPLTVIVLYGADSGTRQPTLVARAQGPA